MFQACAGADETADGPLYGVGGVENLEGPADDEQEGDDGRLALEALKQDTENLPALRCSVDVVKGRGIDDGALNGSLPCTCRRDHHRLAGVLAGWDDPGEQCAQDDERSRDGVGMWNFLEHSRYGYGLGGAYFSDISKCLSGISKCLSGFSKYLKEISKYLRDISIYFKETENYLKDISTYLKEIDNYLKEIDNYLKEIDNYVKELSCATAVSQLCHEGATLVSRVCDDRATIVKRMCHRRETSVPRTCDGCVTAVRRQKSLTPWLISLT